MWILAVNEMMSDSGAIFSCAWLTCGVLWDKLPPSFSSPLIASLSGMLTIIIVRDTDNEEGIHYLCSELLQAAQGWRKGIQFLFTAIWEGLNRYSIRKDDCCESYCRALQSTWICPGLTACGISTCWDCILEWFFIPKLVWLHPFLMASSADLCP